MYAHNGPVDQYGGYPYSSTTNSTMNSAVTGSEKIKIKQDANEIVTKEKSSFHNPVTGITETFKAKTKGERASQSRSRSRSNSSERRRRNNMGYQQPMYQPMYQQPMVSSGAPVYNHTPSDLYAQEKGKIRTTENSIRTTEKLSYVDPVTGLEQNTKIKSKVVGDRSRSKSNGKSKTTYNHKVEDTVNGPRTVIKEKHREGGVMANIKNKINNLMGR